MKIGTYKTFYNVIKKWFTKSTGFVTRASRIGKERSVYVMHSFWQRLFHGFYKFGAKKKALFTPEWSLSSLFTESIQRKF